MRNGSRYTLWRGDSLSNAKRRLRSPGVVTDLHEPALVFQHPHRTRRRHRHQRRLDVDRVDRVVEEHVLDVHEQQLLVLLLVVQAEHGQRGEVGPRVGVAAIDQLLHRGIDVGAVARDLLDGRAREQAPLRSRMTRTDGLVVRVEEVPEVGIEDVVPGERGLEEERLEEPGRVTAVPLGRAHVGHRLNDLVLGPERSGERFREVAYAAVARAQRLAVGVGAGRTVERGHSPSDPKQAATHAALRLGRSHSTTEIIVCLPCLSAPMLQNAFGGEVLPPDVPVLSLRGRRGYVGLRQLFTRPAVGRELTKSPVTREFHTSACSKYGEWPAPSMVSTRAPGPRRRRRRSSRAGRSRHRCRR